MRNSLRCYSFSSFFGRKPGGFEQPGDGALPADTINTSLLPLTAAAAAGAADGAVGGNEGVAGELTKEQSSVAAGTNINVDSLSLPPDVDKKTGTDAKGKSRGRYPPKAMQTLAECTTKQGKQERVTSKHSKKKNALLNSRKRNPLEESASVAKLFMVSESLASIFCALPQNQRCIDNYLNEVDKAVLPPATLEYDVKDASEFSEGSTESNHKRLKLPLLLLLLSSSSSSSPSSISISPSSSHSSSSSLALQSVSAVKSDIAERILHEERANHTLCIHVRDMVQLVPPCHLLHENEAPPSKKTKKEGVLRRKLLKLKKICSTERPQLTSLERILELHKWQKEASKIARQSQELNKLPDECHSITRVRPNDPSQSDLTVVLGSGSAKTVADVLAAIEENMKKESDADGDEAADDDCDGENSVTAAFGQSGTGETVSSTLFTLKPLLSVVATCIPRREPTLYSPCGEETFFSSANFSSSTGTRTAARKSKKTKKSGAATGARAKTGNSTATEEIFRRQVPPMPRFTTRVTLLMEHDDLEAEDSSSKNEKDSVGKDGSGVDVKQTLGKKRIFRVYCHIADGGEY